MNASDALRVLDSILIVNAAQEEPAIEMAKDAIRKTQWIPVSEKLPETDEMVLVTCKTQKGIVNVNRAYYSNEYWHGSGSMSGVVAWMPLPIPYMQED